jgi:polysaccharide deacetylase 2 family uncharacterized protein YibQ
MARLKKRRICWKASSSPHVESYKIYWVVGEGVNYESDFADVGHRTEVLLPDDIPSFPVLGDRIELAVTAVDEAGNESDMVRCLDPLRWKAPEAPLDLTHEKIRHFPFPPVLVSIFVLTFLAGATLLTFYLLLSADRGRAPVPVYEEIFTAPPKLQSKIREIDHAIYESLYHGGIRDEAISFLDVQPRYKDGDIWEVAELLVKCSDEQSALELVDAITLEVSHFGPQMSVWVEKTSNQRIICHVYTEAYYTHKIVLSFEKTQVAPAETTPKIAIIVDDLGYDSEMALSFMKLKRPLTLSVLPSAPFTDRIVHEATSSGCELILHLPMEPRGYPSVNPGPGALFLRMGAYEIRRILDQSLRRVPGARGVNNHMGSSFTENREKMAIVLKELQNRRLFFIDSQTTSHSVGFHLAKEMGLHAGRRNVFLDHDLNSRAIRMQMERLLSLARHTGSAIGILHPHKETLEMLKAYLPKIKKEYEVVPVSELVG